MEAWTLSEPTGIETRYLKCENISEFCGSSGLNGSLTKRFYIESEVDPESCVKRRIILVRIWGIITNFLFFFLFWKDVSIRFPCGDSNYVYCQLFIDLLIGVLPWGLLLLTILSSVIPSKCWFQFLLLFLAHLTISFIRHLSLMSLFFLSVRKGLYFCSSY